MAEETSKISIRIPADYAMWLQRQVDAKREQGLRSSITDEVMACIVHRMISMMPAEKRKNLAAAIAGGGGVRELKIEEQAELMPAAE